MRVQAAIHFKVMTAHSCTSVPLANSSCRITIYVANKKKSQSYIAKLWCVTEKETYVLLGTGGAFFANICTRNNLKISLFERIKKLRWQWRTQNEDIHYETCERRSTKMAMSGVAKAGRLPTEKTGNSKGFSIVSKHSEKTQGIRAPIRENPLWIYWKRTKVAATLARDFVNTMLKSRGPCSGGERALLIVRAMESDSIRLICGVRAPWTTAHRITHCCLGVMSIRGVVFYSLWRVPGVSTWYVVFANSAWQVRSTSSRRDGSSRCNELSVLLEAIVQDAHAADNVGILQAIPIGEKMDAAACWWLSERSRSLILSFKYAILDSVENRMNFLAREIVTKGRNYRKSKLFFFRWGNWCNTFLAVHRYFLQLQLAVTSRTAAYVDVLQQSRITRLVEPMHSSDRNSRLRRASNLLDSARDVAKQKRGHHRRMCLKQLRSRWHFHAI